MEYSITITVACSGIHVDNIMITTTTKPAIIGANGTISKSL